MKVVFFFCLKNFSREMIKINEQLRNILRPLKIDITEYILFKNLNTILLLNILFNITYLSIHRTTVNIFNLTINNLLSYLLIYLLK